MVCLPCLCTRSLDGLCITMSSKCSRDQELNETFAAVRILVFDRVSLLATYLELDLIHQTPMIQSHHVIAATYYSRFSSWLRRLSSLLMPFSSGSIKQIRNSCHKTRKVDLEETEGNGIESQRQKQNRRKQNYPKSLCISENTIMRSKMCDRICEVASYACRCPSLL